MSIAKLKRNTITMIDKITAAQQANKKHSGDENIWKPFLDDEKGIGAATIRFLPAPDGEELPIVQVYDHGFQGPKGKYYIENSLSTLGQQDPVSELNFRLWKSDVPSDIALRKETKRRTNYYTNILVISDPGRPQNEGKVFKYRFGPVIQGKLDEAMNPKFPGVARINPFDLWNGAVFQLRAKRDGDKRTGFWKYDASVFDSPSELFPGDDDAKEAVYNQCFSMAAYLKPANFKSFAELSAKLVDVLGTHVASGMEVVPGFVVPATASTAAEHNTPAPTSTTARQTPVVPQPAQEADTQPWAGDGSSTDDDMAFFAEQARKS